MTFGRNLIAATEEADGIHFLYIPPAASQAPVEGWTIPPFPFEVFDLVAYPSENVLAIAEHRGK